MEDQERTEGQEDTEAHGLRKKPVALENEEPTDELAESDDVEAHAARRKTAQ